MSRLEKIKQHQYDGYTIWDMGEDNLLWLIEQAERVQNLESRLAFEQGVTSNLQSKNKRYREALEEIARGRFPGASYKARKALESEE